MELTREARLEYWSWRAPRRSPTVCSMISNLLMTWLTYYKKKYNKERNTSPSIYTSTSSLFGGDKVTVSANGCYSFAKVESFATGYSSTAAGEPTA